MQHNGKNVEPEKTPINPKEEEENNNKKQDVVDAKEEYLEPNQVSQSLQSSQMSDEDDDEDNVPPAKDLPLLQQIAFIEHKENLKKLGVSQKVKKIKPLVAPTENKQNALMGTQRVIPSK